TSKESNSPFLYEAGLLERPREEPKPKQAALPVTNGSTRASSTTRKPAAGKRSATVTAAQPAATKPAPARSTTTAPRVTKSAAATARPARATKPTAARDGQT